MLTIRKMRKDDVGILYDIALRSFQPDYEKYGAYPPLLNLKRKKFMPPRFFGKVFLVDNVIVGGAFVLAFGKKGEIGSIFIDPNHKHNGYGRQAMFMFEKMYSKVRKWKLDTLAESYRLHRYYESLGYIKTGEMEDKKSGIKGFIYTKTIE